MFVVIYNFLYYRVKKKEKKVSKIIILNSVLLMSSIIKMRNLKCSRSFVASCCLFHCRFARKIHYDFLPPAKIKLSAFFVFGLLVA